MTATTPTSTAGKASASGPAPYRVLLIGEVPLDGVAALADALATRTGHGVDVEALPVAPPLDRDLSRYDAAVLLLEPERDDRSIIDEARRLVDELRPRLTVGSATVLVLPPASAPAPEQDEVALTLRRELDPLIPVLRLEEPRTSGGSRWAAAIAGVTAPSLIDPMVRFLPDDHFDEDLRLDAVDGLPPRDRRWVAEFQAIVEDAKRAYGTSSAALSIIDADYARYGVTVGFPHKVIRRGQTICNRVLRTYGGLIVGDAQLDLRFQRNPDVKSGDVRFYAGYRIEAENGAPLGSLCVFDPAPRDGVAEEDLVALRDLAVAAQERMWRFRSPAS